MWTTSIINFFNAFGWMTSHFQSGDTTVPQTPLNGIGGLVPK